MTYLTTKQLRNKEQLWLMVAEKKTGAARTDAVQRAEKYRNKINRSVRGIYE
jgi:hypothetical protein